jgi:RNA polymerase sigma factor (sigma-70 family)
MQPISKHRIVPGFNKRDPLATSWVYQTYYAPMLQIVKKITHDSPEAEDLTADIFDILLHHTGPFESIRKIEIYLYSTARNISLEHRRRQQMMVNRSQEVTDHYLSLEELAVENAERNAKLYYLIQLAIDKLPTQSKEVFLLCFTEHLKNAQIAKKLRIKEKTVANHKLYAYKKLKMEMEADPAKPFAMSGILGMLLL